MLFFSLRVESHHLLNKIAASWRFVTTALCLVSTGLACLIVLLFIFLESAFVELSQFLIKAYATALRSNACYQRRQRKHKSCASIGYVFTALTRNASENVLKALCTALKALHNVILATLTMSMIKFITILPLKYFNALRIKNKLSALRSHAHE